MTIAVVPKWSKLAILRHVLVFFSSLLSGISWSFLLGRLSGPLRLRVQSRSRTRLRIAASIAFLFHAYFKGAFRHYSTTIARLSPPSGLE